MGRYELSDEQYALIEGELPSNEGKTGHPWLPHRPIINGIFWRLHTGAPWPDVPERYGNWKTIYDRYAWWRRDGTWERILKALQVKLDAQGLIDFEQWAIDSSVVRAHRVAAGARKAEGWDGADEPSHHALGRSTGGFSTKIHLISDSSGVPLDVLLTPGQTHESTQAEALIDQVSITRATGRVRKRPGRLAADRAYDVQRIRHFLRARGVEPIIPPRKRKATNKPRRGRPVTYNKERYRKRSTIEQSVGWLKEYRAVATRYEKLALNYLGLVKLAIIERYLRLLTRPQLALLS
jgi:transposase